MLLTQGLFDESPSGVPAAMDATAPAVVAAARSHGGQRTIKMTAKLM